MILSPWWKSWFSAAVAPACPPVSTPLFLSPYLAKGTDAKILPQDKLSYLYRWLFHSYDFLLCGKYDTKTHTRKFGSLFGLQGKTPDEEGGRDSSSSPSLTLDVTRGASQNPHPNAASKDAVHKIVYSAAAHNRDDAHTRKKKRTTKDAP